MADRVSARIAIGGTLPRSLLDELKRRIGDEDLRLDWEGEPFTSDAIPNDGPVDLMAHDVAWGHFEHLERFCRDHALAYVRWSGGCAGSFGPERVVFTGSGEAASYAVTEDDELVLDLETIRRLGSIAAIEARASEGQFRPGPLTIVDDIPSVPRRCAMAEHFTKASFAFTCSTTELMLLEEAFLAAANLVIGHDPDPPSPELLAVLPRTVSADRWSGLRALFVDPDFPFPGAELSGGHSPDKPRLSTAVIFGMTGFQPEAVARLVQCCCRESLEQAPVGFTWAWTCSKPRTGEFGGGWCAIFADWVESGTAHDALAAALRG